MMFINYYNWFCMLFLKKDGFMGFVDRRYNQHFEGYERQQYIDENGLTHSKMVYTREHYIPMISDGMFIFRKILFCFLFAVSIIILILEGLQRSVMNSTVYIAAGQAACVIAALAVVSYLCLLISAEKRMEIRYYKGVHKRLTKAALVESLFFLATFLYSCVFLILTPEEANLQTILCAAGYMIAAACNFVIWFVEKGTCYETEF